jgi:PKD repeat protein|tara:strand:- start:7973 stop:10642 length:2670 start_codon:yes stop_codon:yes gene_type:complete
MKLKYFIILFIVLFTGIISANFEIGDLSYSIDKQYRPSENIRGWLNISLDNELANSILEDSNNNSINLIDFLDRNKDYKYTCSTIECLSDYSATSEKTTKTFNLNPRESEIIGFKFNENLIDITSVEFDIESDVATSCYNQLKIDFFNNGKIDIGNDKVIDASCSFLRRNGCFDENANTEEYILGVTPYCQKIELSESPGFKLGAWVKKISGNKEITMSLYDNSGNEIQDANCKLEDASNEGGEISCDVDYLVTESKDHYICINSNEMEGEYKIKGYSNQEGCGFYGYPVRSEAAAYNIFTVGKMFDSFGTKDISNSLQNIESLGESIKDYIIERYGSLDCSNECIIPIKIIAQEGQTITIDNLKVDHIRSSGEVTENRFYDLTEIPSKVNSEFQKVSLNNGNFSILDVYGDYTFALSLNDKKIFSEEVTIEKIPEIISITPMIAMAAYLTEFSVIITSDADIINYEWDFGNGDIIKNDVNKASYTYKSTGKFDLKITIVDSNDKSSHKVFNIDVKPPIDAVNTTLESRLENINNVKSQINNLPVFYQDSLNKVLGIDSIEDKIESIQKRYSIASSDEDYINIFIDLLDLNFPRSIATTKTTTDLALFYPDKDNINLDVLKAISGDNYNTSKKEGYSNAILSWNQGNIDTKINFKEISANYNGEINPLLNIFELRIKEKNELNYDSYIIFRELENLRFKENYGDKKESGYIYINLKEPQEEIVFSTTEDIDFNNLPLFISPGINRLVLSGEELSGEDSKKSKWIIFILVLFLLIFIVFVVYIIMQEWYKRKYENYLFKNRNNLYNLVSYIGNSKKKGMKDNEIISKLKKSKWKSEQISYVMRKYSGKRTGMFEVPIDKLLSVFKNKNIPRKQVKNENLPIKETNKIRRF